MKKNHSFHIPVMGISYTIDSPLKVSQYGIDSVISITDDMLLEKIRKTYCQKNDLPYSEISDKTEDYRAKRITSYLNLIKQLAENKFDELKNSTIEKGKDLANYFKMLPDKATIKREFNNLIHKKINTDEIKDWIKKNLSMGSIDVNIMTKVDKSNFIDGEKLPTIYNDAHAALRGFAMSNLSSSVVFSAGMNPQLYSYIAEFKDFFPTEKGKIKKKIILKVSDYRSALIQGKFLAKKGLWVSEYRIESGLNCGGHAFATDGFLMGPILQEFKDNREDLIQSVHELMVSALEAKGLKVPTEPLPLRITAQGGVGTNEEHDFLLNEYGLDSIGWGTPFLLVPEATTVDKGTLQKLKDAKEKDLYLSNVSPLGVPFNNLRGNSKDDERSEWIDKGRPGSACTKKFLSFNTEFTEQPICTASRQYQHLKLKELKEEAGDNMSTEEYKKREFKIEDKSCICVGLGTSALLVNDIETKTEGDGVSICPGPNMAYFSEELTLSEMTDHIYGRMEKDDIVREDRPHVFVKELDIYLKYFADKIPFQKCDILIADTNAHKTYFSEKFNIPSHKIHRVEVGVDTSAFSAQDVDKTDDKFHVGFYGTFNPLQGIDKIVDCAFLLQRHTDIVFDIIGTGYLYDGIKRKTKSLAIENVNFKGWVKYDELSHEMNKFDICLGIFGDSVKANWVIPNKIFHYASLGKCILTRDTQGIKEAFTDRENIVLCDNNPQVMADSILKLKEDKILRKDIGTKSEILVSTKYSEIATAKKFVEILKAYKK